MNYAGHQFGNWAGQLGDGRAINLGELNQWSVQLKRCWTSPTLEEVMGSLYYVPPFVNICVVKPCFI